MKNTLQTDAFLFMPFEICVLIGGLVIAGTAFVVLMGAKKRENDRPWRMEATNTGFPPQE